VATVQQIADWFRKLGTLIVLSKTHRWNHHSEADRLLETMSLGHRCKMLHAIREFGEVLATPAATKSEPAATPMPQEPLGDV